MTDDKIIAATVRLPDLDGQGVLIPGGLIATAAHCVSLEIDVVGASTGDAHPITIETESGDTFELAVLFIDPIADLAVLDKDQETGEEFYAFIENTNPIPMSAIDPPPFEKFPVRIRSHERLWVTGEAQCCNQHRAKVCFETIGSVKCGTSGGPIVDASGMLVSVVSHGMDRGDQFVGMAPFVRRSLPMWLLERIASGE